MAVAGLHNVSSAFNPSFFGDSRPSTRASTLLQMWRELENEHVINQSYNSKQHRNGSDTDGSSTSKSIEQNSDNGDYISRHSNEYDAHEHDDDNSVISEDLGETERERVRQIFREWMSNNGAKSHFRLNSRAGQWPLGENECERVRIIREWVQTTTQERKNDCGSVRDGVGSQIEQVRQGLVVNRVEIGARRPIRRLCGRQTLLDLLMRAQSERKRELVGLAEQRPVSEFAHRNRIQALFRGRFLRNEKSVLGQRPSSRGATELGLLRQRQTVSDLREGFLSKLDNCGSTSLNIADADSSSTDENNCETESTCRELNLENGANEIQNIQELEVQVTEADGPVLCNDIIDHSQIAVSREEPDLDTEARQQEVLLTDVDSQLGEHINVTLANESSLQSDDIIHGALDEDFNENYVDEPYGHTIDLEENTTNEELHSQDDSAQVEENSDYQIFPEPLDDNVDEPDDIQELHQEWPHHDLQEAIDSWLDLPSEEISVSVDSLYLPEDDNVRSMELRELFSRRRVSSLLRSGFRESLDQVLQSHVERLEHAVGDWELDNASSFTALIEQDQEQLYGDQTSDGDERNPFAPSSTLFSEFQGANWSLHNSNLQLETEWEVINELRIDMARLQQRMNDMQNMLEACMEMQIELQRSVRQELSAALNRSNVSTDENTTEDNRFHDESKWDCVRKGICCLCRDSKIDSLLYRCGHMCTCSKCAENLVECEGKCPMCRAPAVEVVQAYFIQ